MKLTNRWILAIALAACLASTNGMAQVSPKEAQAIAEEAFIYAYPMLFNYKTLYQYTQDHQQTEYAGGLAGSGTMRAPTRRPTPPSLP